MDLEGIESNYRIPFAGTGVPAIISVYDEFMFIQSAAGMRNFMAGERRISISPIDYSVLV